MLISKFTFSKRVFSSASPLFNIALLIQRSPIIQLEKSKFEKAYQSYFYEVEKELSRGPFKLTFDKLAEDSKASLQSNENGQISIIDADCIASEISEKLNELSTTDANRSPKDKLFLVTKKPTSLYWEFPSIDYTDTTFENPLHKVRNTC